MACAFWWTGCGNGGLKKEKAAVDLCLKDIAPGTELWKRFGHAFAKWEEFKKHYLYELNENREQIAILKEQLKKAT